MKSLKGIVRLLWFGCFVCAGCPCLHALQDNAFARFFYAKELSPGSIGKDLPSRVLSAATSTEAQRVRFQFNSCDNKQYYFFSNEVFKGVFPLYSTGSYIIRKNEQGEIDQIKVFLLHRKDSFIRLSENKGQTLAVIQLFGKPVYTEVYLAKRLSYFALAPLSELKLYLSPYVEINYLFPSYQATNHYVLSVLSKLQEKMNLVHFAKDGAMNDKGQFVHIADNTAQTPPYGFNCSGFAKWVADGFYKPATGKLLSIERLKRRLLETRGKDAATLAYEYSRDPYFGLDWVRNIATVLSCGDQEKEVSDQQSLLLDVSHVPFLTPFRERGFSLDDLEFALFLLTVDNPDCFYFGSVNTFLGKNPVLLAHRHVSLFFSWIDEFGFFHVSVVDVNGEKDIDYLKNSYPLGYVYLVKLRADKRFELPTLSVVETPLENELFLEKSR